MIRHEEQRLQKLQSRIADAITSFAGSMTFVYVHIVWFTFWILVGGILIGSTIPVRAATMIVSLEAIFLRPSS